MATDQVFSATFGASLTSVSAFLDVHSQPSEAAATKAGSAASTAAATQYMECSKSRLEHKTERRGTSCDIAAKA